MPKIKICGIKNESEAQSVCACEFGGRKIDFIGLIFAPSSKRKVSAENAAKIAKIAHGSGIKAVGVFAGNSQGEILQICERVGIECAQIYEKISSDFYAELKAKNISVWQVFSVKNELPNLENLNADFVLFDASGANAGGNGVSFEWSVLNGVKIPFGLAGGLSEKNALNAQKTGAKLLDFNSKLENSNLEKIPAKITEILEILSKNQQI